MDSIKLFFLILFSLQIKSWAQTPIGLAEGLMGNSGLAISDSTAPSYYNPSLLGHKTKEAYSISASTFDRLASKDSGTESSSTSNNPGYLSSIILGNHLNHEFFLLSMSPSRIHVKSQSITADNTNQMEGDIDLSSYLMGYTMAFRDWPMAFSFFAIYGEQQKFTNNESFSTTTPLRSLVVTHQQNKDFNLGISISSHVNWDHYTLGFQYRSRTYRLYDRRSGQNTIYTHGSPTTGDFTKTELSFQPSSDFSHGETISIGHGFNLRSVEILTDTILAENNDLIYKYTPYQTFGLRVGASDGHQFLFGVRQQLGSNIKYFGQSTYYSGGYSWKTRGLRSSLGVYFYENIVDQDINKVGLSYSTEFAY